MNSCGELGATVRRESNRLIVRINEVDLDKACGVASLTCEFIDDSESIPSELRESTGPSSLEDRGQLKWLTEDLERAKELLEVKKKRKHDLEMKEGELGRSTLTPGELAELRKLDKEIPQLKDEVADMDAKNRQEEPRSSDDIRPYQK